MHLFRSVGTIIGLACMLPPAAASQAEARPAEVQRLQFYVGHWNEAGQMRSDPNEPFKDVAGGETCTWSAGGYAVVCEEKTEGPGGGWEGVYILSYDAAARTSKCPCHFSIFDPEKRGQLVCGQATQALPRIVLSYDDSDDGVRAVFVEGLIYGRASNLIGEA